jgi:hypothetical protein
MGRYDSQQTETLEQRLAKHSKSLREQAKLHPPGAVRDAAISKAQEVETGTRISEWLSSPGLRLPR